MTDLERQLLKQIIVDCWNLWGAALRDRSPAGQKLYEYMKDPQIGDLVVERSTGPALWLQDDNTILERTHRSAWANPDEQMGVLREHGRRPIELSDEAQKEWGDDPIPDEEFWTIERLTDHGMTTWTNADFIRIPRGALR